MAVQLSPELEQRLVTLASNRQRDPMAVLGELIRDAEDEDAEFVAAVEQGVAELDAGEGVPHEEAMERLRRAASGETPPSYRPQ